MGMTHEKVDFCAICGMGFALGIGIERIEYGNDDWIIWRFIDGDGRVSNPRRSKVRDDDDGFWFNTSAGKMFLRDFQRI